MCAKKIERYTVAVEDNAIEGNMAGISSENTETGHPFQRLPSRAQSALLNAGFISEAEIKAVFTDGDALREFIENTPNFSHKSAKEVAAVFGFELPDINPRNIELTKMREEIAALRAVIEDQARQREIQIWNDAVEACAQAALDEVGALEAAAGDGMPHPARSVVRAVSNQIKQGDSRRVIHGFNVEGQSHD